MLELRPSCEHCDKTLPAQSADAMICSFECTFCSDCVRDVLRNVCPNCGGGFCPRPIRPGHYLRNGDQVGKHPASVKRIYKPVDPHKHRAFSEGIRNVLLENR
ncbi:MAG: DUF1272 domain-containing protein [Herminiimonas sp.]|nr:DUF1272 domain-containing protein [Herminiimonas sp.]